MEDVGDPRGEVLRKKDGNARVIGMGGGGGLETSTKKHTILVQQSDYVLMVEVLLPGVQSQLFHFLVVWP